MKILPESVRIAWANREGSVVLATVDAAGVPNAILREDAGGEVRRFAECADSDDGPGPVEFSQARAERSDGFCMGHNES
jgi:hypothetical protein